MRGFLLGISISVALIAFGAWSLLNKVKPLGPTADDELELDAALDEPQVETSDASEAPGTTQAAKAPQADKQLLRSTSNRVLAGVCSGLAERFGLDVHVVRVLWVLLTLWSGGLGLLIYLAMIVIVPNDF